VGFGEGRSLLLGKRNPSSNPNLALDHETEIIADSPSYGTRQSNKRDGDGGGAIYGCRSNLGNEPCIRANNLKGGHAFQFVTTGTQGGRIEVGNVAGAPFTTNATGVATGLNADKVDGREAADFALATDVATITPLFARVTDPGGGDPTVTGRGATSVTQSGATWTVTFNKDVSACSWTASPTGTDPQALSVAAGPQNTQVNVSREVADADTSFQLQVIC
jgi:hypothetical protein